MASEKSAAELRIELEKAEARERAEREAQRERFPIRYRYTIRPEFRKGTLDRLYDDTCCRYVLKRKVLNLEEARDAGHSSHDLQEGQGSYLFNTGTGKIVCTLGGGSYFINANWQHEDGLELIAFDQVNEFLKSNPNGGDITDIVERLQTARKEWRF